MSSMRKPRSVRPSASVLDLTKSIPLLGRLTCSDILLVNIQHRIVQCSAHQEFEGQIYSILAPLHGTDLPDVLTVDPFLVCEGLSLLCLVPVQDQSVPEGKSGSSIGSALIAIVQGTGESGLNVADSLLLEVLGGGEGLGGLSSSQCPRFRNRVKEKNQTHKLLPSCTLRLWDAGFDTLDVARPKSSHSPLVLWSGEVGWPYRTLEICNGGARRRATLAHRRCRCHAENGQLQQSSNC